MTYLNNPRPAKKRQLYTRCCDGIATSDQLRQMYDDKREITLRTFAAHADLAPLLEDLGYVTGRHKKGMRLKDDYHVRYFKSKFRGQSCYYMDHSAIDHIFLHPEQVGLLSDD